MTAAPIMLVNAEVPAGTSAADIAALRGALESALQRVARIKPSCHDCKNWDIDSCTLHGAVPADFQDAEGQCDDWLYDGVPW